MASEDTCIIYVLRCKGGKWYVGKTQNLITRLYQHKSATEEKVAWLKVYPPDDLEEFHVNMTSFDEDKYTELYMEKYGINNVRGGSYVLTILPEYQIKTLERKHRSVSDLCFKCGGNHFAKECTEFKTIESKPTPKNPKPKPISLPTPTLPPHLFNLPDDEKIVYAVRELNGGCGRLYIAHVLADDQVKPKHATLTCRGIGNNKPRLAWVSNIDKLIAEGRLKIVQKGVYALLTVNESYIPPIPPVVGWFDSAKRFFGY